MGATTWSSTHDQLDRLVVDLDVDRLAGSDAHAALGHVLAMQKVLAGAELLLLRRVRATGAWSGDGERDLTAWHAARSGGRYGASARSIETAESLVDRPALERAVRAGALSGEQAAVIAAAARADPGAEDELVARAADEPLRSTRRRADRVIDAARSAEQEAERTARQQATRAVRFGRDRDGSWTMDAKLPPPLGAEVQAELERLAQGAFTQARTEGRRESQPAYLADALVECSRRSRQGAAVSDRPAPKPKVAINVVIDLPALRRGTTARGERCELAGIGPVPAAWVREQIGEATLRLFLRHGTAVATMATTSRSPTDHMLVVLDLLYPSCAVCDTRYGLEVHHATSATGWAETRRTTIPELVKLCRHHHDRVTAGADELVAGPSPYTWRLRSAEQVGPGP